MRGGGGGGGVGGGVGELNTKEKDYKTRVFLFCFYISSS